MRTIIFLLITFFSFSSVFAQEMNSSLAKNAQVVLRVECTKDIDLCDKFCVQEVKVLKVLKNETKYTFPDSIRVSYYSWEKGVPKGISTIYVEKYASEKSNLWKLIGGKAKTGVSHQSQAK
ncbi:MAG: hypothetical protein WCY05_05595 [Candidatus Omnitrophota bacterium]